MLLAAAASHIGAPLIHLSTDYVFDGRCPRPHRESDPIAPINAYGRSKAAGETKVRLRQPHHVIVRTSWVHASHGGNFVKTVLRLAAECDEVAIVGDQWGAPTAAQSIAEALVVMSERIANARRSGLQAPWGTYHFTDKGETTWHGFAEHVFSRLEERGMRRSRLRAIATEEYPTLTRRPASSRLGCTLIERTFGIVRAPWQEGAHRVLDELLPEPARMSVDRCVECEL